MKQGTAGASRRSGRYGPPVTHPVDPPPTEQRFGPDRFLLTSAVLLLFSFVLLPVLLLWADANPDTNGKFWLTPIFLVNPVLFLVLSLIAGRRFGARAGLFIVAALAFFAASSLFV